MISVAQYLNWIISIWNQFLWKIHATLTILSSSQIGWNNLLPSSLNSPVMAPHFYRISTESLEHLPSYIMFHEACTYSHFQKNSTCPICNTVLSENDFFELIIADPMSKQEQQKAALQNLFMRRAGGTSLSYADLCSGIMQQIDDHRKSTKFLLKQVLNDVSRLSQKNGINTQAYQSLKQAYIAIKNDLSNTRLQADRNVTELQNRLKSRDASHEEMQRKLNLYESRLSTSSHPHALGSSSGVISERSDRLVDQPPPPMQQYAAHKAEKERSQRYSHSHSGHNNPTASTQRSHSLGGVNCDPTNVTPIQRIHRPFSGSNSTGSGQGRLRQLSSSSNFVFSSHNQSQQGGHINKRRRSGTPTSVLGSGGPLQHVAGSPRGPFASPTYNGRSGSAFSSNFSLLR